MTFNLWNYSGQWNIRRELAAELILSHAPDVVALQESRHDFRFKRGRGQGEQVAELTGYRATSAVAQVYLPILRVDEGLTILTRDEPANSAVCRLTQHPEDRADENRRICLAVTLTSNGKRVHVFDTHFSLGATSRIDNAVEVQSFVRRYAGSEPGVLMGDLNAEPEEPAIRFLTGAEGVGDDGGELIDCWEAAHPGEPGYTYASFDPVRRIDYILAYNLPPEPISAVVDAGPTRNGIYASDHMSVVADLPI